MAENIKLSIEEGAKTNDVTDKKTENTMDKTLRVW